MNLNRNAHLWRAREREPIGGLGALPPVGSRGKAPGGWLGGLRPLKLTIFRYLEGKLYIEKLTVFNICLPNQSCKIKAKYCLSLI
jgi:hypothetical protein